MQRIRSGFFWNRSTLSMFGKAHARCTWMGQKTCGNTVRLAAAAMLIARLHLYPPL